MRVYKHYTIAERESLALMILEGKSQEEISKRLDKSKSSISREISRNSNQTGEYNPWGAHSKAVHRRRQSYKTKIGRDEELQDFIISKLNLFWPPETIAAIWNIENPNRNISFISIYRSIKNNKLPSIKAQTHLRRRGKRKYERGASATIKPEKTIHERFLEANERQRIGDWEGDTVAGAMGKGRILTNVDRKSRYLAAELVVDRSAVAVGRAMVKGLIDKPCHSITLDRGSEFARFKEFEKALKTNVFFADPHSPWQRGTNENTNGILRFFFPKGFNFKGLADKELQRVVDLINERPRKCLGWRSPKDVFSLHFI